MFSFAMTCGLASDSDKFKIIITLRLSLALLSVVGAIGRAGLRKEVGLLRPGATWPEGASAPNGMMMCRGHGVPEMVTPAMRTTAVLLGFFNLKKMPCSVLP